MDIDTSIIFFVYSLNEHFIDQNMFLAFLDKEPNAIIENHETVINMSEIASETRITRTQSTI